MSAFFKQTSEDNVFVSVASASVRVLITVSNLTAAVAQSALTTLQSQTAESLSRALNISVKGLEYVTLDQQQLVSGPSAPEPTSPPASPPFLPVVLPAESNRTDALSPINGQRSQTAVIAVSVTMGLLAFGAVLLLIRLAYKRGTCAHCPRARSGRVSNLEQGTPQKALKVVPWRDRTTSHRETVMGMAIADLVPALVHEGVAVLGAKLAQSPLRSICGRSSTSSIKMPPPPARPQPPAVPDFDPPYAVNWGKLNLPPSMRAREVRSDLPPMQEESPSTPEGPNLDVMHVHLNLTDPAILARSEAAPRVSAGISTSTSEPTLLLHAEILASAGVDEVCDSAGSDSTYATPADSQGPDAMLDTPGPDAMLDSAGPDAMLDSAGPDAMLDSAGPDAMLDSAGPDAMLDSPGPDAMLDSAGPDAVLNSPGPDAMLDSPGPDAVLDSAGPDAMLDSPGSDAVPDSPGPDAMLDSPGPDAMLGSPGLDAILDSAGADAMPDSAGPDATPGGAMTDGAGPDVIPEIAAPNGPQVSEETDADADAATRASAGFRAESGSGPSPSLPGQKPELEPRSNPRGALLDQQAYNGGSSEPSSVPHGCASEAPGSASDSASSLTEPNYRHVRERVERARALNQPHNKHVRERVERAKSKRAARALLYSSEDEVPPPPPANPWAEGTAQVPRRRPSPPPRPGSSSMGASPSYVRSGPTLDRDSFVPWPPPPATPMTHLRDTRLRGGHTPLAPPAGFSQPERLRGGVTPLPPPGYAEAHMRVRGGITPWAQPPGLMLPYDTVLEEESQRSHPSEFSPISSMQLSSPPSPNSLQQMRRTQAAHALQTSCSCGASLSRHPLPPGSPFKEGSDSSPSEYTDTSETYCDTMHRRTDYPALSWLQLAETDAVAQLTADVNRETMRHRTEYPALPWLQLVETDAVARLIADASSESDPSIYEDALSEPSDEGLAF